MAYLKRFELLAHSLEGCCSILLSYRYAYFDDYVGGLYWFRTSDTMIKSHVLYQLS